MSPTSHPPRDYQIAELTQGIRIPLPSLQRRHGMVIAEYFAHAWNGMRKTHANILLSVDEPEINALMETRLDVIRFECPEWSMLVTGVSRGKESVSFDGKSLEKRPDLSVHLTNRPFRFPLIVECKIIDTGTRKDVAMYCDNGIVRFLEGEYAWYAQEAFMLAYVRDGATIADSLTPHFEKKQKETPDPFLTEQLPHIVSHTSQDLALSRHGRSFMNNPGSIAIWHLWLS